MLNILQIKQKSGFLAGALRAPGGSVELNQLPVLKLYVRKGLRIILAVRQDSGFWFWSPDLQDRVVTALTSLVVSKTHTGHLNQSSCNYYREVDVKLHDKAERHFLGCYASYLLRLRVDEKGTIVSPFLFCIFFKITYSSLLEVELFLYRMKLGLILVKP